jgi:putative transposase
VSDRPHRLPGFSYLGLHRYSLTFCVRNRDSAFTTATIVAEAIEQILLAAKACGFEILAYCFMPDHLHLLVEGRSDDSDLTRFVHQLKQRTSFTYRRHHQNRLWQEGYFEHVLRDDEVTQTVAKYIFANPVRAGLVKEPLDYPFSGSLVYSREQLIDLWHGGTP